MGHTGFIENNKPGVNKKSEGNKTPLQVDRVRNLGGLVAVILHQGKVEEIEPFGTRVSNDCGSSSKTWSQAYLYAVDRMRGGAVAFGSDFNGLAGEPAPRFGPDACAGESLADQGAPFAYPFRAHGTSVDMDRSEAGSRSSPFDFNYDGLAHIGMYPDFINDLKTIGLTDADLTPLCNSAGAYVTMWEKAENNPPVASSRNVTVPAGADCTALASIDNGSFDPDGDPITLSQSPGGPYGPGTTVVTLTVTDSFGASSTSQATVTVVDDTPPSIAGVSVDPPVLWPPTHEMTEHRERLHPAVANPSPATRAVHPHEIPNSH